MDDIEVGSKAVFLRSRLWVQLVNERGYDLSGSIAESCTGL